MKQFIERNSNEFNNTYIKLGVITNTQVCKDAINILFNPESLGVHGSEARFDKIPKSNNFYSASYISESSKIPLTVGLPSSEGNIGFLATALTLNISNNPSYSTPEIIRVVKSETDGTYKIFTK
jgi:hypothetical protein